MASTPTWISIKKELAGYDSSDLLELIQQLYNLSSNNKAFLMRVVDKGASIEALRTPAINAIRKAFDPPRGHPTCKTGEARRATMQFVKSAPLFDGYEMMLYYVQCGIKCTQDYGDTDEPFYNSIESVWESCLKTALKLPDPNTETVRLKATCESGQDIGWGFSDALSELLESEFLEKLKL
jgi:hypothetical protein